MDRCGPRHSYTLGLFYNCIRGTGLLLRVTTPTGRKPARRSGTGAPVAPTFEKEWRGKPGPVRHGKQGVSTRATLDNRERLGPDQQAVGYRES